MTLRIIAQNLFSGGKNMFLQILYAIAKGLLEMDGYQVTAAKPAPADDEKVCCPTDNHPR